MAYPTVEDFNGQIIHTIRSGIKYHQIHQPMISNYMYKSRLILLLDKLKGRKTEEVLGQVPSFEDVRGDLA